MFLNTFGWNCWLPLPVVLPVSAWDVKRSAAMRKQDGIQSAAWPGVARPVNTPVGIAGAGIIFRGIADVRMKSTKEKIIFMKIGTILVI